MMILAEIVDVQEGESKERERETCTEEKINETTKENQKIKLLKKKSR